MIELPEAITLARQITRELKGKQVACAERGNSPHKFAFYNRPPEEYAAILPGKTVGEAWDSGGCIMVAMEPGYVLELGGGGERIRLHRDQSTLPAKHQLMLGFTDGTALSMTVQMWGSGALHESGPPRSVHGPIGERISPVTDAYTLDYFLKLHDEVPADDKRSVKFFLISQPGVWGLGNGYAQDVMFLAGLHPRHRTVDTTLEQRRKLYQAVRETLLKAVELGGRDTEQDLFGNVGRYVPILDRRAKGNPCPKCGTTIEAMAFLGGTSYYCPKCQV